MNPIERRRSVRVPVTGHRGLPVGLLDVSLGGFSLQLAEPLIAGSVQDFALTLGDGSEVVLRTRVVHAREVVAGDGAAYITGLEFLSDVTDQASATAMRLAS